MDLDKMAATLFKTECHWKTKQRAKIVIANVHLFKGRPETTRNNKLMMPPEFILDSLFLRCNRWLCEINGD